jgi:SAM-dependent methyltransferase
MLVGLAIFWVSFAVLGYEVLLMRLLTITQWHHFAYMIISVALLGFGASGTLVTLWQRWLVARYHCVFQVGAGLFAVGLVASFLLAQRVPLNPLEILWDRKQWGYLLATYLLLFFPFFCAATCIALSFVRFKDRIHRLYLFDLLGAGSGALGIMILLYLFPPLTCLQILSAPGLIAAALISLDHSGWSAKPDHPVPGRKPLVPGRSGKPFVLRYRSMNAQTRSPFDTSGRTVSSESGRTESPEPGGIASQEPGGTASRKAAATWRQKAFRARAVALGWLAAAVLLPLAWPHALMSLQVSEYKGLSMALRVPGARIVEQRFSPLGWLTVVESSKTPFRYVPGMSLTCTAEPPQQLAVFTDGDSLSPITRFDGTIDSRLNYLDCVTSALPYHLLNRPKVLVLGPGGGSDVLSARYHGAEAIDAVELDANMVRLVRRDFADFAGQIYDQAPVRTYVGEARSFVTNTSTRYDLIQVSLLDSFATAATGSLGLSESYLYTVEAFQEYLRHLNPGGMLAITRWLKVPPRDSLKLFATALAAMKNLGTTQSEHNLVLIRGWRTTTLLVKNGALSASEAAVIRQFCEIRSFDVDYYPGIRPEDANRFNLLERPYAYEGALALLGEQRDAYLQRYKFALDPATDDRPYFFHFFKWATLPEFLAMRERGGLPLIEWGYPILVLTLVQALVVSIVLILLPLALSKEFRRTGRHRARMAIYFSALGFGFLFLEMAFIQKLILFLGHPLFAVAVVLSGFLLFAGLGSSFSEALAARLRTIRPRWGRAEAITVAACAVVVFTIGYLLALPPLLRTCMGLPEVLKVATALLLIAPLAFFMGMPFPLGLSAVSETAPAFVPWAWGVNGCTSVLSSILATIIAIHLGFSAVMGMAAILYGLAAVVLVKGEE